MISEVVDPKSGAILFKKDGDSKTLEQLQKKVKELERRLEKLEGKKEENS